MSIPQTPTNSAEFSGTHADIMSALKIAEFGINPKEPNPAQRGVRIQTGNGTVTLASFDFETAVSVTLPCTTPETAGTSLLDHTEMVKIMGAFVAGETKTVAARTPVALTGDLLTGSDMTVPIAAPDPATYTPAPLPAPAQVTLDPQVFLNQLLRTLPARGTDDTLPTLTGVAFTLTGQTLTLAATDRYRFAVADIPAAPTGAETADGHPTSALIPGGILKRLVPVLKTHTNPLTLGISPDGGWVTLTAGQTTITQRTLDGRLPRHDKLFPTKAAASVSIPRTTLDTALKKSAAVIKAKADKNTPVSLLWDGTGSLTLAPVLPDDQDRARFKGIPLPHTTPQGDPAVLHRQAVTFNPAYFADALAAFTGDTLTLHLPEGITQRTKRAVLFTDGPAITGDSYRHLLMSIRLEDGIWNL
ncbi:DNA polymerase III subunit beta [Streptomyces roseolus]|uniref:DNA polymerase III subunit beta n=1 Tax=Streptomyces roseolus TaxID=67358 RepID=UPI00167C2EA9|nr:DNA polymerase III subunit beta [Streptomyces roseolus]GGR67452.1 DNA polymerase III subunit beta [Streptomyces roseolus]